MSEQTLTKPKAEYRIDVLNAFDKLTLALASVNQAVLSDKELVAWMSPPPPLLQLSEQQHTPRELANAVLNQILYSEKQAPREILVCPGFVGSSEQTLEAIRGLNLAKEQFKQSILNLKKVKGSLKDKELNAAYLSQSRSRSQSTADTLNQMGLSKLHLKQCYRKVPVLSHPPLKISWTWAHTRSIKRISVAQAQAMLLKKNKDSSLDNQLQALTQLASEEPLAIVQELAPHLRANILLSAKEVEKPRVMIKGPVPIFFPATTATPAPSFKPPGEKAGKDSNRLIRNDVRLEPTPFLPAIRAHRYSHEK